MRTCKLLSTCQCIFCVSENYLAQIENNCFGDEITSLLTNHYYVVDHIEEVFKDSSKVRLNRSIFHFKIWLIY